jgi:hypothetical protein
MSPPKNAASVIGKKESGQKESSCSSSLSDQLKIGYDYAKYGDQNVERILLETLAMHVPCYFLTVLPEKPVVLLAYGLAAFSVPRFGGNDPLRGRVLGFVGEQSESTGLPKIMLAPDTSVATRLFAPKEIPVPDDKALRELYQRRKKVDLLGLTKAVRQHDEVGVPRLMYLPSAWASLFLAKQMSPFEAYETVFLLVQSIEREELKQLAEPLLRWLRAACFSKSWDSDDAKTSIVSINWTELVAPNVQVVDWAKSRLTFRKSTFVVPLRTVSPFQPRSNSDADMSAMCETAAKGENENKGKTLESKKGCHTAIAREDASEDRQGQAGMSAMCETAAKGENENKVQALESKKGSHTAIAREDASEDRQGQARDSVKHAASTLKIRQHRLDFKEENVLSSQPFEHVETCPLPPALQWSEIAELEPHPQRRCDAVTGHLQIQKESPLNSAPSETGRKKRGHQDSTAEQELRAARIVELSYEKRLKTAFDTFSDPEMSGPSPLKEERKTCSKAKGSHSTTRQIRPNLAEAEGEERERLEFARLKEESKVIEISSMYQKIFPHHAPLTDKSWTFREKLIRGQVYHTALLQCDGGKWGTFYPKGFSGKVRESRWWYKSMSKARLVVFYRFLKDMVSRKFMKDFCHLKGGQQFFTCISETAAGSPCIRAKIAETMEKAKERDESLRAKVAETMEKAKEQDESLRAKVAETVEKAKERDESLRAKIAETMEKAKKRNESRGSKRLQSDLRLGGPISLSQAILMKVEERPDDEAIFCI